MDFKPSLEQADFVSHIVHREIAHFWVVVMAVAAIVGSLYAYDSAVAQGLSSSHQAETARISSRGFVNAPYQCRDGAPGEACQRR